MILTFSREYEKAPKIDYYLLYAFAQNNVLSKTLSNTALQSRRYNNTINTYVHCYICTYFKSLKPNILIHH